MQYAISDKITTYAMTIRAWQQGQLIVALIAVPE